MIAGWGRYDPRLLDEREWAREFEDGPAGAAVHALVVAPGEQVVGHHCAIPIAFRDGGRRRILGKGEALYVEGARELRNAPVEHAGAQRRPVEALTAGLYEACPRFGLEAYFGYATPEAERRHVEAGCVVVEVPYRRLGALRDPRATVRRSQLGRNPAARAGLTVAASGAARLARLRRRTDAFPLNEVTRFTADHGVRFVERLPRELLAFEPSAEQLNWRFDGLAYRRLVLGEPPWGYVVLTPLEPSGRRRVVDWLLPPERLDAVPAIARALVDAASDAVAVEWAVPANTAAGSALARAVSRSLFLRDPRRRMFRLVISGGDVYTRAERWALTLATQERF